MRLPTARGPASATLVEALTGIVGGLPGDADRWWPDTDRTDAGTDPLSDEDLQLFLFVCYELHYRGFDGVDERWEWDPSLLAVRAAAERRFEAALRRAVGPLPAVEPGAVPEGLTALVAADDGPSLATALHRETDLDRFREFVTQRSVYHLREADPHTWGIPRLDGPAKAALVEIQMDEYGRGQLPRMHAELFRDTMNWLGLDTGYGGYVDSVPAVTLAANNLISLFGLHRRWRGALLGHLAAFEMTSSLPNRRYGDALRRLGGTPTATRFYDEHVEADAVHEQIAAYDLCGSFALTEPARTADVLFGAACCLKLDGLVAEHVLGCWAADRSSLRLPLAAGH
ncbi:iron-containing redox enzyme family protein [Micromonospora sp. NPDC004704]